jgi:hypothetical protein
MNPYVRMILWMGITAAISFFLIRTFGLLIGLALSFGVFILLNMFVRRRQFGAGFSFGVTYRCIVCGQKFRGGTCPRCGSKMKKAEF